MAETRELWFRFFGDTKSLDKASTRGSKSLGKVDKKAGKTSRSLSGLNKAMLSFGLAIGAMEIARWANDAAKMADSAEIAAKSIEKVLGPATESFQEGLEENRRVMGLNALEVDQLGAKMGLLFTGMGVGEQAAADFGVQLVGIAGDLAAFRGDLGETPAALDAMQAALRGEFDPLEQFGVKLSAAKIEAEKLRLLGIDPMFASLSDGEQTMSAVVSLIQREAAPAMGALGDAMDSTAAKSNELSVETEDLQTELGAVVNEVKGPLISALTGLLRGFINVNQAIGRFIGGNAARLVFVWIPAVQAKFAALAATVASVFAMIRAAIDTIFAPLGRASAAVGRFISKIKSIKIPSFRIPGFASGGIVGGARGAPQLAVVHGGERVTTANGVQRGDGMDGGSPLIGVLNVQAGLASPDETARAIVDLLTQYNRTNGSIPITISEGLGT